MRYDEYKDSQTPWMGTVPNHWALERAKWSFTLRNERGNETPVLLAATQKHGMYPQDLIEGVVKVAEGTDVQQFRTVHRGDFVISLRSFQGGFERSDYEGVCSPAYQVFYADDRWDTNYLKYLFKNELFIDAMNALTVGIREGRNIKYEDFANSVLAIPPISEQKAIADFLDKKIAHIDSVIAEAKASIEEYKEWKASIIYEAVTKGLDPDVEMKDSGIEWIGDVPKNWKLEKLKRYTSMLTPMRDKPERLDGEIPWIRIEDYCGKYIDSSKEGLGVSIETVSTMNLKVYPVGTILCTSSCDLGKCAIVSRPLVSNQRFIGIIPNEGIFPDFLYYLMLSNAERLNYLSTGAIQANLSRVAFEQLIVQVPPYSEQREIAKYLDEKIDGIDAAIQEKHALVHDLESYKKSLIFEVVTGKRRVC